MLNEGYVTLTYDVAVFGAGASAMKLPQFDSTVILMVPLS